MDFEEWLILGGCIILLLGGILIGWVVVIGAITTTVKFFWNL